MNDKKKATKVKDVVEIVPEDEKTEDNATQTEDQSEETQSEEKKNDFFDGIKKGFNDFIDKSKKFIVDTGDKVNEYFAAMPEINALNKLFEQRAVKLTDVKTGKERLAVITENKDGAIFLLRKDGDGTVLHVKNEEIKPDAHFSGNGKIYKIVSVDNSTPAEFTIEGNSRKLECFTATAITK